MLKIEVIKFEAQDVITASVAAPVEEKCICPTDFASCSNGNHFGPNGEPCPGDYRENYPVRVHHCPVN